VWHSPQFTSSVSRADSRSSTGDGSALRAANLHHVEVHQGDARHLPLDDAAFDLVTSEYMLNLMPHVDIVRAVFEFHRVLKPGGRLIVTNMTQGVERHHRIWDALYARGIDIYVNCRGVLAAPVLEQAGFTDIRREYMVPGCSRRRS
jgi:ubiquinone/menaquinone biosynthesis C-methylase UbiE